MVKINSKGIVEKIRKDAMGYFEGSCPPHDWTHVQRVYDLCSYIGKKEGADIYVLQLAALLNDTGRKKESAAPDRLDHAQISSEIAMKILKRYSVNGAVAKQVLHCILSHRFRKEQKPETLEAKILFDADKIDCIGAIGVARAYAFVGKQNMRLYPDKKNNKEFLGTGYEKEHSAVTEFAYKLSKVKGRLFTKTAKQIACQRHRFMENFFKELNKDISVNK